MKTMTFTEFRRNASKALDLVEKGDTIQVLRHGRAVAKLTPLSPKSSQPSWKQAGLRLMNSGASICKAILEERRSSS